MDKEQLWITLGYNIFALEGINGLKIERLAKMAGKNKSSFYHFFVDTKHLQLFDREFLILFHT